MDGKKEIFNKKIQLSDTLLLAICPLIGYSVLFAYRAGYLVYFNLPLQFIEFSIGQIFIVTASLLGIFFLAFPVINLFFTIFNLTKLPPQIVRNIRRNFSITIFALIGAILFYRVKIIWWASLGFLLIGLFADILVPLLLYKTNKNYIEKLESVESERRAADGYVTTILDKYMNVVGVDIARLTVYLFFGIAMVFVLGQGAALNQSSFYIANTDPKTVVLYMTANKAILAEFDSDSKVIGNIFYIVELDKHPEISFSYKHIGPFFSPSYSGTYKLFLPTAIASVTPTPTSLNTLMDTPTP